MIFKVSDYNFFIIDIEILAKNSQLNRSKKFDFFGIVDLQYLIWGTRYLIGEAKYLIREVRTKFNLMEVKFLIQASYSTV